MQWIGNLLSWVGLIQSNPENDSTKIDPVDTNENDTEIPVKDNNKIENDIEKVEYKIDDIVYYKDVACKIIEIHDNVHLSTQRATIQQIIDGKEINTEFPSLISEKQYIESQNDSITKQILNDQKSESILAMSNDNENSNSNNENSNSNNKNTEPKPKSNPKKAAKNKSNSKKKSSKKKTHIAQIQKPPKKSKRRQKVVKRKNSKKKSSKKKKSKSAKTNVKKKQLKTKTAKIIVGSKSVTKSPNGKKRRLTEIGINNNKSEKKIESPPKKRRRMTEINVSNTEKLVEKIYGERIYNGNTEYFMKWRGYKVNESTWEKENGTDLCKEVIKQFKEDQKNEKKSKYMQRVVREVNSNFEN